MEFPKTLIEFQERFPDEASCWTFVRGNDGRAGSCALAVEAAAATSSRRGASSSVAGVAIKPP